MASRFGTYNFTNKVRISPGKLTPVIDFEELKSKLLSKDIDQMA